MKKILFPFFLALFLGITLFLLFAQNDTEVSEKPVVAASIFPLYDITKQIAGDRIDVVLILPPGASPHTFEPTPSLMKELQPAEIAYLIGAELDEWAEGVLPESTVVQHLDDVVTLREYEEHEDEEAHTEEEDEHGHEGVDPHYWLSIPNAMLMADAIHASLSAQFPEYSAQFSENLSAYRLELTAADQEIRTIISQAQNKRIVTFHDAWYYFAEEYDVTIVGTFEPTAGREPTPQYLAELTRAIQKSGSKTLFSEPQLNTSSLSGFLRDLDLTVSILDPIGGIETRDTYINLMRYNAKTIFDAK